MNEEMERLRAELHKAQDEEARLARNGETEENREELTAIRARIGELLLELGNED